MRLADMSLKAQAKILRILQEKKFERVGGNKLIGHGCAGFSRHQ